MNDVVQYKIYKVQNGDSLIKIAYKFNMSVNQLQRVNDISENVYPGQLFKIVDNQGDYSSQLVNVDEVGKTDLLEAIQFIDKDHKSKMRQKGL